MSLKLTQAKESGKKQHCACCWNTSAPPSTSIAEAHSTELALLEKLNNSLNAGHHERYLGAGYGDTPLWTQYRCKLLPPRGSAEIQRAQVPSRHSKIPKTALMLPISSKDMSYSK